MRKSDYRQALKRDLEHWQETGLLNAAQAQSLFDTSGHGLTDKQHGVQVLPVMIGLAIALGFLSIIAANWAEIAPGWRITLVTLIAAAPIVWAYFRRAFPRPPAMEIALGISAVLIGGLLVTIGQAYHTEATTEAFLRSWMIGALILSLLMRSNAALLISSLLLVGFFWASSTENVSGLDGPPLPPLLFWAFCAIIGFVAWCWRALASWHALSYVLITAVLMSLAHFIWPYLPEASESQARIVTASLSAFSLLVFLILETVRRRGTIWGMPTLCGWAALAFAVNLFWMVLAFRFDVEQGTLNPAYWASALIGLFAASGMIAYGGLLRRAFYRVFGVILFVGVAGVIFVSVGGLMQSGIVLIAAGVLLLLLLRFSGRILEELVSDGEPA